MDEPRELELRRYLECQREVAAGLIDGESLEQVAPGFLAAIAEPAALGGGGACGKSSRARRRCASSSGWSIPELDASPLWKLSRELDFDPGDRPAGPGLGERRGRPGPRTSAKTTPTRAAPAPPRSGSTPRWRSRSRPVPIPRCWPSPSSTPAPSTPSPSSCWNCSTGFAEQLATFISRRRAEAEIRAGEQFKAAVMAARLSTSIVGMDQSGAVIEFNAAAERLFGYTREEALGREMADLIIPSHLRERHRAGLLRYLEGERQRGDRQPHRAAGAAPRRLDRPGRADGDADRRAPSRRPSPASSATSATGPTPSAFASTWPRSSAAPRTRSSARTSTASSPPGTRPPNASTATTPRKRSGATSPSSSRPTTRTRSGRSSTA